MARLEISALAQSNHLPQLGSIGDFKKAATVKAKLRRMGRATRAAHTLELRKSAVARFQQKNMSETESTVGKMMLKTTSCRTKNGLSILFNFVTCLFGLCKTGKTSKIARY